jgi:hypothetical protein
MFHTKFKNVASEEGRIAELQFDQARQVDVLQQSGHRCAGSLVTVTREG